MEKIEFITAIGTDCCGYLLDWQGLALGLTQDSGPGKSWDVIELLTGCSVVGKSLPTRKKAIETAFNILDEKGLKLTRKKIKDVLLDRVNKPVMGRLKTVHCIVSSNRLKTACGRVKDAYCLPPEYLKKAKKPCRRCLKLVQTKKST
jgi:hypothetical protein